MSDSTPSLPPGPRLPRALQTLAWGARPGPFMQRCRARYGDTGGEMLPVKLLEDLTGAPLRLSTPDPPRS